MIDFLTSGSPAALFTVSVAALCLINLVLALLMLLADATINSYGKVVIKINADHSLDVEGGQTLLNTLKEEGIFIPSACGGKGSCGLCKCTVLKGGGDFLPTEAPWITAKERAEGVRLSCQIKVKSDVAMEIPEELFSIKQYETEVVGLRDLTHDIKELRLKLRDPDSMDFIAGQFVQIEVPENELSDEPVYRAYSISSEPFERNIIELEVRLVPNGICSTYVHKHLRQGDKLLINGPHGDFRLQEGDGEIICIAGGSGMAPIKSILMDMLRGGSQRPARYFFGARDVEDIFLLDEMKELESQLPNFKFIPALSNPKDAQSWDGEVGLITEVVGRHLDNGADKQAYLCGSALMIDACIKVLTSKGMPETAIFYDKF